MRKHHPDLIYRAAEFFKDCDAFVGERFEQLRPEGCEDPRPVSADLIEGLGFAAGFIEPDGTIAFISVFGDRAQIRQVRPRREME